MSETLAGSTTEVIEGYWIPGCSSCLRMKEFLEKSGVPFRPINAHANPEAAKKLESFGLIAPAVVVGDRAIQGLDLVAIAELIGYDYTPPVILAPGVLRERYAAVTETAAALVGQLSAEQLQYKSPDRNRSMAELAGHIGSIMQSFLHAYDSEDYETKWAKPPVPLTTSAELVDLIEDTHRQFEEWWRRFGFDDPLDRIVNTNWGMRTLHEALERAVWHPAQHTRQLTMFVGRMGLTPARRLTDAELAGLPIPEGIHAGGESV